MLLWVADETLATTAREAIERAESVHVSAASVWEIEVKRATGRLNAPGDIDVQVDVAGYERMAITFEHAIAAGRLPALHGDPFDRMLVAQAQVESLTLMTADPNISRYRVATLGADRR